MDWRKKFGVRRDLGVAARSRALDVSLEAVLGLLAVDEACDELAPLADGAVPEEVADRLAPLKEADTEFEAASRERDGLCGSTLVECAVPWGDPGDASSIREVCWAWPLAGTCNDKW